MNCDEEGEVPFLLLEPWDIDNSPSTEEQTPDQEKRFFQKEMGKCAHRVLTYGSNQSLSRDDFVKEEWLPPEYFGVKGGIWGRDLEEGKFYRGRAAVAKIFRRVGDKYEVSCCWKEDWQPCNPAPDSIFFLLDKPPFEKAES